MSKPHHKHQLLALLYKPLLTRSQLKRIIAKETTPNPLPPARRWYVSLCRTYLEAIFMAVCGIALGLVFVVLWHYTGLEAWMDSMRNL